MKQLSLTIIAMSVSLTMSRVGQSPLIRADPFGDVPNAMFLCTEEHNINNVHAKKMRVFP